jgi:hypothetical protein
VTDRAALLARYRELVLTSLPARAGLGGRGVQTDHCSGRIVLDPLVRVLDAQSLAWRGKRPT